MIIKYIQNQSINNIEIILIDDGSKDNYIKRDENNNFKKNKGTIIARNKVVLYSKGKYLILLDPDNITSKNILKICYYYCEKYKFEITIIL